MQFPELWTYNCTNLLRGLVVAALRLLAASLCDEAHARMVRGASRAA